MRQFLDGFSTKSFGSFGCMLVLMCSCEKETPPPMPPVPITAVHVIPQNIPANFEYVGVAESSHIVELRARVEGYLEKIGYQEGGLVHANDVMFVLDQRPFVAALDMAKGDLARQEALLWNAEQSKNRMVPLYKQNAVSQRDLDDALAQELAAKASVMTAQANVAQAKLNLEFASIEAPVTGMASKAIFREGALISPGPNSLLTNIYVIDPIWVNFSVSEGDILKARKEISEKRLLYPEGMQFSIEVVMADNSTMPAAGKIDFTDPALQQSTGTMLVRSILANPLGWLRPGQFVRVVVKGATRPNAIIVPQTAVLQGQNGTFVYVVTKDGKAAIRPVDLGDWYKDYWIINSGLAKGDIVIALGINRVQNNTPVVVKTWMPSTPAEGTDQELQEDSLGF
ncbi:MAG: efflux RND transporter periplasmic adaptor subunit [Simkania sp.]|nr:efflux RND transporter periplasmic adaptor subunit [Simkania sp.]